MLGMALNVPDITGRIDGKLRQADAESALHGERGYDDIGNGVIGIAGYI